MLAPPIFHRMHIRKELNQSKANLCANGTEKATTYVIDRL
jgi:hypothetical protein